ncbi:hypothetical protein GQ457_16G003680 [Hibiscus cannabinus]
MENRFKLRISRIFRSSFSSCRNRNVSDSDVVEKAVFSLENHNKSASPPPPKDRSLPSICKPRCSYESTQETLPRRRKIAAKAPPASPMSRLNLFSECRDFGGFYEKKKSSAAEKKKNSKRVHAKRNNMSFNPMFFSSSSHQSVNQGGRGRGWWWFSSEDDETETLFSSMTLSSSDSSSESPRRLQHRDHRRKRNARRRRAKSGNNKVKDSFAVVKSSDDPYTDFRASMVEMIVEREIFEANELEQLLQCFLSLNSHHHHRVIVMVFTEICKTLFSNWS